MTNLLTQSLVLFCFLVAIARCIPLTQEVSREQEVLTEQDEAVIEEQKPDGVKAPLPDTKPISPVQSVQTLVPGQGQVVGATPAGNGLGIGNIINFRRFGPWQDIGLDLLGGLIQVTVNRTPGNKNVAVRVGNQEINVGK